MSNKEDWEELEKWAKEKHAANVERVGLDINNFKDMNNSKGIKKINILTRGMSITYKIIIAAMILFFILSLVYIYFWAKPSFERLDVDLEGAISGKHQIELITVSKDTDKKGNGSYVFSVKGHEDIQFIAIKKYGNMSENYDAICMKYYFDKWNSPLKNNFKLVEDNSKEIVFYDLYIEISDYSQIENAVKCIYEFIEFTNGIYSPSWSLYIKQDNYRIYPDNWNNKSLEDIILETQKYYKEKILNK